MNKFRLLLAGVLFGFTSPLFAQMSNSIKINEVMTNNTASLQDEYGHHNAWVEIANISHTTYNIRGMYITTDRSVLNKDMSVPERIKRMSVIPNGYAPTKMSGREHIIFYCNSNPANGAQHLTVKINPGEKTWIALYDGNAVNLIDSITIPALEENLSFAREDVGSDIWEVKTADAVTPGINNYIKFSEGKIAKLKRDDPHGFGITVLSMGIVFTCLALLYIFFKLFGIFVKYRKKVASIQPIKATVKTAKATKDIGHKTNVILQDGLKSKGIDKEVYIAVISMALKQYQDNVHDVESGIITIKPKHTDWDNEYNQMKQFHE